MAVENTLHGKHQIHLGPPASLHGGRGGNDEEREGEKLRNAVLWLGVGSQRGMAGQTRHSPSPSDPLSESVAVLASEQVSSRPLPSHTIEQALCLIGVSWWLPRGRSRGGGGGGARYQTPLSDLCVWTERKGTKNQTALWIANEEQRSTEAVREERRTQKRIWATRGFFFCLPHTSCTT